MVEALPISLVTGCRGRLSFLQQALPTWLAIGFREIVVVDASCPDGTAQWVESLGDPRVRAVRITSPHYPPSQARNAGARVTSAPWLAFIDADILLSPALAGPLGQLKAGHYYRPDRTLEGLIGQVVMERTAFDLLGGYDEVYRGYGDEDIDIHRRLNFHRRTPAYLPSVFMRHLPHADSLRTLHTGSDDKEGSIRANNAYGLTKIDIMNIVGRELDLPLRRHLYDTLTARCRMAMETNSPQRVEIDLPATPVVGMRFERKYVVSLKPEAAVGQLVMPA